MRALTHHYCRPRRKTPHRTSKEKGKKARCRTEGKKPDVLLCTKIRKKTPYANYSERTQKKKTHKTKADQEKGVANVRPRKKTKKKKRNRSKKKRETGQEENQVMRRGGRD